jgi:hypothetical protein
MWAAGGRAAVSPRQVGLFTSIAKWCCQSGGHSFSSASHPQALRITQATTMAVLLTHGLADDGRSPKEGALSWCEHRDGDAQAVVGPVIAAR